MRNTPTKNVPRKRRTRAEWAQIIERFDSGNKNPTDFCRAEGIGAASFAQWRKKLRGDPASTPRFVELKPSPATTNPGWQVELVLGNDVVLRLGRV